MSSSLPVIQPGRPAPGQGAPTTFNKVGIVGLGLIGGSIALATRQLWPSSLVVAVDDKDVLETAMRLHAIDVAADDLIVLAEVDIVVLAAPVKQNVALVAELGDHVRTSAVVTDVGSTKREMIAAGIHSPDRHTEASSTRDPISFRVGLGFSRPMIRPSAPAPAIRPLKAGFPRSSRPSALCRST